MLRFYYEPRYKYTNRTIIDISEDDNYREINYENIDSPDTINGHIIYKLNPAEKLPTYVLDTEKQWRWFVSGITQLRTGKFQISLLRDIISETSLWKEEEAYISAGTATDYNKYKRWDLPYTNTKVGEQRLNINGKSSFFVFYVNQQEFRDDGLVVEQDLKISYTGMPNVTGFDYTVANLNEIPYFQYVDAGAVNYWTGYRANIYLGLAVNDIVPNVATQTSRYTFTYDSSLSDNDNFYKSSTGTGGYGSNWQDPHSNSIFIFTPYERIVNNENNIRYDLTQATKNFLNSRLSLQGTRISKTEVDSLSNYVNKIIYNSSNNKVYTIRLQTQSYGIGSYLREADCTPFVGSIRNLNFPGMSDHPDNFTINGNCMDVMGDCTSHTYTLEELGTASTFSFNFIADQRKLPKSAVRCVNIVSNENTTDDEITQALMLAQTNGINEEATTGRILDIQYLPFSIANSANENIKINDLSVTAQFLDFDDYQYTIDLPDLNTINKETDTIKIVSPSRASQFLFRPYDNDGSMLFNAKITLKPYSSVIYIRPSTRGLLLQDWDDKDCLIIQEDFSLTNVTSQWTQYVYNNRTYLNSFERQIQGREFERSWERKIEQAQAKSDEWTARNISAQKAQTYTANLPIISGIAGAIGTAFMDENYMKAAQLDREYNEALYQEGISLSRDMFEFQMENIQSQPLIPSRITTIDCKTLDGVYIEIYSTNESELNAINNFYRYNGNRIDSYGSFGQYYGHFVRGKIIKSINYTQPEIDELNRRLSMGIFTEVIYDK